MEIKHLLYDEKFTIAGAKKRLQEMKKIAAAEKKAKKAAKTNKPPEPAPVQNTEPETVSESSDYREILLEIKKELKELKSLLEG